MPLTELMEISMPPSMTSESQPSVNPHRSRRTSVPSEKQCATEGIPYVPPGHQPSAYVTDPSLTDQHQAASNESTTYAEAMASPDAVSWRAALQEEFDLLKDLVVYKLIPQASVPKGQQIMKGQPIFCIKHDENGVPVCFKARYVC